jgi:AbrB family looped-hinge helix DNA binding protein
VISLAIVTSTVKGQIVIPAALRKKFGIVRGTPVNVYEQDNKIVLEPVHRDPILVGKGILKTNGRVLRRLKADRNEEAAR